MSDLWPWVLLGAGSGASIGLLIRAFRIWKGKP